MPFWKKMLNQKQAVYYPRAIVQGKPVETETIAKDLAKISTVSNSDVQAVLGDIAGVMHTRMSQGKSVHIKGLGYFRYVLDTTGVKDLKDFDFEKQVKAVRVEFVPERTRLSSGAYTRALVDSEQLEWINFQPPPKIRTRRMAAMAGLKKIRWDEKKSGSGLRTYFMNTGLRIVGIGGWYSGGICKKTTLENRTSRLLLKKRKSGETKMNNILLFIILLCL